MARVVTESSDSPDLRERIVAAGLSALSDDSTRDLTVRHVARLAGSSTMCIYTTFGGRAGMVKAVYGKGFEILQDSLSAAAADAAADPDERIVAMAIAYRRFALERPALYALMFERPLADFDPPPQLRTGALEVTLSLLATQVGWAQSLRRLAGDDAGRPAYLLWSAMHGLTSIELTHARRNAAPGWSAGSPEGGEQLLVDGVRALLAGLR